MRLGSPYHSPLRVYGAMTRGKKGIKGKPQRDIMQL